MKNNQQKQVLLWDFPIEAKSGKVGFSTISEIFDRIRKPNDKVLQARKEFTKHGKSLLYRQFKNEVSSFYPAISFAKSRSKKDIQKISQLMYIDIDLFEDCQTVNFPPSHFQKQADILKEQLFNSESAIYAIWKSVSGSGLGVLIKFEGLTKENYLNNWISIRNMFANKFDVKIDEKAKNINRACFISYDESININENSTIRTAINEPVNGGVKNGKLNPLLVDKPAFLTPNLTGITIKDRYFDTSFIDIHFASDLAKIKPDGLNVLFNGRDHYWFRNSFPFVRLVGRKKPIKRGSRHKILIKTLCTLVFLNSHWSKESVRGWLYRYSADWCIEPLETRELDRILEYVFEELRPANLLSPCVFKKKNHFTSDCRDGKEGKQLKINQVKPARTRHDVFEAAVFCMENLIPMNNSNLTRISELSRPTVIKRTKNMDINAGNQYITITKQESIEYEGILIDFLPDFKKLLLGD